MIMLELIGALVVVGLLALGAQKSVEIWYQRRQQTLPKENTTNGPPIQ